MLAPNSFGSHWLKLYGWKDSGSQWEQKLIANILLLCSTEESDSYEKTWEHNDRILICGWPMPLMCSLLMKF